MAKQLYDKTNSQVEAMSKIGYFLMVKLSVPLMVGPKALVSYYNYFSTDLGPDAFELSIPAWCVFYQNRRIKQLIQINNIVN